MTANYQMGEANLEALRKELGPLGDGIYYLCKWAINHRI